MEGKVTHHCVRSLAAPDIIHDDMYTASPTVVFYAAAVRKTAVTKHTNITCGGRVDSKYCNVLTEQIIVFCSVLWLIINFLLLNEMKRQKS